MHSASELADWYDRNKADGEQFMEEFVVNHPHFWVIGAVSSTQLDVLGTYVDMLRFGEGLAEGGAGNLVKDFLRALSIAGPVARGLGLGATAISRLRLFSGDSGNVCSIIASINALRRTGQRPLISAVQVAEAHGIPNITQIIRGVAGHDIPNGLTLADNVGAFARLKIPTRFLGLATGLENVLRRVASSDGVVMVRLIVRDRPATEVGHLVLAERVRGVVKFIDRDGRFYDNLADLGRRYNAGRGLDFVIDAGSQLVLIPQSTWKILPTGSTSLMLFVNAILDFPPEVTPQQVDTAYQAYKTKVSGGFPSGPSASGSRTVNVVKGTTLSGVSMAEYKTFDYWPLLWDKNRSVVGDNPNRLKVGQKLTVPTLSTFSAAQLADAKKRAPTWRNYPS